MKKLLLALVAFFAFSFGAFAAVNLNTATKEELDTVKGIGPVKAQAIIDYRNQHGPFRSVDDLKNVKGFGEKTVNKMRSELTVSGPTSVRAEPAKPEAKKAEKAEVKKEEKAESGKSEPAESRKAEQAEGKKDGEQQGGKKKDKKSKKDKKDKKDRKNKKNGKNDKGTDGEPGGK